MIPRRLPAGRARLDRTASRCHGRGSVDCTRRPAMTPPASASAADIQPTAGGFGAPAHVPNLSSRTTPPRAPGPQERPPAEGGGVFLEPPHHSPNYFHPSLSATGPPAGGAPPFHAPPPTLRLSDPPIRTGHYRGANIGPSRGCEEITRVTGDGGGAGQPKGGMVGALSGEDPPHADSRRKSYITTAIDWRSPGESDRHPAQTCDVRGLKRSLTDDAGHRHR